MENSKIKVNVRTILVPSVIYRKSDIYSIAKTVSKINGVTYELLPFKPIQTSKFKNVKQPGDEFVEEIKNHIHLKFPNLRIKE